MQVGNLTRDRAYWGPPERATLARPVTVLTATRPGTDVLAMTAAALASAAVALRDESSQVCNQGDGINLSTMLVPRTNAGWSANACWPLAFPLPLLALLLSAPDAHQASGVYLARAQALYKLAQRWPKTTYSRSVESSGLYPSTSVYDDLAFAAVWCGELTSGCLLGGTAWQLAASAKLWPAGPAGGRAPPDNTTRPKTHRVQQFSLCAHATARPRNPDPTTAGCTRPRARAAT